MRILRKRDSHIPAVLATILILTSFATIITDCRAVNESLVLSQSYPSTDYLIITSESMVEEVQPLARWKTQRGLFATIQTVEDIEQQYTGVDLGKKVKNCIKDYYENESTTWVVLAGGEDHVPTRTVVRGESHISCDFYYANLDDNWDIHADGTSTIIDTNDWEPEVFVGRLPADTEAQMESLVSRLINYERNPPIGPWMKTAVFAGAFASFAMDENGNDILDEWEFRGFDANRNHNWLEENIFPPDFDCILLGETEGVQTTQYQYDYPMSGAMFRECVNNGTSIVMTDGHGSPTSTVRAIFSYDADGDALLDLTGDDITSATFLSVLSDLDPGGKLGLYFLCACSTGTFVGYNCLTEYITRTSGIGCIGSSQSAGYDPNWYDGETLGWYTQGLSERFWRQIFSPDGNHPGRALALAKDDYATDFVAESPDAYDGGRTLSQYNLMGDPEVPIWLDNPSNLSTAITSNNETGIVSVHVTDEGSSVTGAFVSIIGESILQIGATGSNGIVQFTMPELQSPENVTITASKNGFIPSVTNTSMSPRVTVTSDADPLGFEIAVISGVAVVALVLVVVAVKKRA